MAMPNYVKKKKGEPAEDEDGERSPPTFTEKNVSIVRASKIEDNGLIGDFGIEQQTAYGNVGAIIHDKIVVIDPLSPDCSVILGSHNLGFTASCCNDENLVIIRGDTALAQAYAVHVLDVYDHYRFRAKEAELKEKHEAGWTGYLKTDDSWQDEYLDGAKGALTRYFAKGKAD
jgi:phosphatidylserine/phosphatidylglycerophosphate/cardiolipin synthase-like enzyme